MNEQPASNERSIRAGILKRIHVNRGLLAANKKHGTRQPPITIQCSDGRVSARRVVVNGAVEVVYGDKQLSCGAWVWVETRAAVRYWQ
jgi:hypothetical protein